MSIVMQVLQLSGDAIGELHVEPTDSIDDIQEVVQLKVLNEGALVFDGVKLQPQDAVDTCGLHNGALVTVIVAVNTVQFKEVSFGALWLRNKGKKGFTLPELKDAGCGVRLLKAAGFTVAELKTVGFTAWELKAARIKVSELKSAGFTLAELRVIPRPCRICIGTGFCGTRSSYAISQCTFCSPKGSGHEDERYVLSELRDAGFRKAVGLSAVDCIAVGFSAADCKKAWCLQSAEDCKEAGFSAAHCREAGFSAAEFIEVWFSVAD